MTGRSFGAATESVGELVFNTSITGYQEILTDPSYRGQTVLLTQPHIGNYGVNSEDEESSKLWLSGLIVSNTTIARPDSLKSADKGEAGGLSGAPLMNPSTDVLASFARELKGEFDLIGAGGIASGADAYRKIRAGAHAVQLYSAMIYEGPGLAEQINRELVRLLQADGFTTLADAVGKDL